MKNEELKKNIGIDVMKLRLFLGGQLSIVDIPQENVENINEYFEHFTTELIHKWTPAPAEGKGEE